MDELAHSVQEFERAAIKPVNQVYVLQLYIAGSSPRSQKAVVNVQKICNQLSRNNFELQVIDIFQQPLLAKAEQIFAVPTLVRKSPCPKRLFIGDLADTETIKARIDS
ncbi:circadian clock protein KaiB [Anaerospora hongkongensis]|uniref:Circadian clock protein KaiB n=1 Tax=Anaerospora hongkongensis TaxID=244830 RepID=A0A4R1Q290_9FIRM|nr:circadian clock KaiB family protein [Anaerospora hongkongensis]TCL39329.1 circadian clock protein KaiB [Anaerospora hongkongensis]